MPLKWSVKEIFPQVFKINFRHVLCILIVYFYTGPVDLCFTGTNLLPQIFEEREPQEVH
jgi:hypothetical protein